MELRFYKLEDYAKYLKDIGAKYVCFHRTSSSNGAWLESVMFDTYIDLFSQEISLKKVKETLTKVGISVYECEINT